MQYILGYVTYKLACFLYITATHFVSWLARKFNLKLYQVLFIMCSYQSFLQFLFSSFLISHDLQLYPYFYLPTFHTRFSSGQVLVIDLSLFLLRPILLAFRIFIYPAFISWYTPFSSNCIQLATSLDIFLSFQLFVLFFTHKCIYNFNSDLLYI